MYNSVRRILQVKCKYNIFKGRYADIEDAKELRDGPEQGTADELAQNSITLIENEDVLPFNANNARTTLIVVDNNELSVLDSRSQEVSNGDVISWQRSNNPDDEEITEGVNLTKEADPVILTTSSAANLRVGQAELVKALIKNTDTPIATVAIGLPYDIQEYPVEVDAHLASFAVDRFGRESPPSLRATVDVIFVSEPNGNYQ